MLRPAHTPNSDFALAIQVGMDGIRSDLQLPPPPPAPDDGDYDDEVIAVPSLSARECERISRCIAGVDDRMPCLTAAELTNTADVLGYYLELAGRGNGEWITCSEGSRIFDKDRGLISRLCKRGKLVSLGRESWLRVQTASLLRYWQSTVP